VTVETAAIAVLVATATTVGPAATVTTGDRVVTVTIGHRVVTVRTGLRPRPTSRSKPLPRRPTVLGQVTRDEGDPAPGRG
jgi:hypothetical protein